MTIDYVSGPFTGRQTVTVSVGRVAATWGAKFRGTYRIVSKRNESHFRSGTVHALRRWRVAGKPPRAHLHFVGSGR
jgi:hypothetical protein